MKERYGEPIYFAEREGHRSVVCSWHLGSLIIDNEWLARGHVTNKNDNVQCEKYAQQS